MYERLLQTSRSVVFSLLVIAFFTANISFAKPLTKSGVMRDAKTLEKRLKRFHPNLYAHRSSRQMKALWKRYKSEVPSSPNYLDAATLFQRMLAAVCDGHTSVYLNQSLVTAGLSKNWVFPVGLVILGDKLYLDDRSFVAKIREVESINNRNKDEIVSFLRSLKSADGCQKSNLLFSDQTKNPYFAAVLLTNFWDQRPGMMSC